MTPSLDTIHHVAIQVQNIRNAVDWYTERYECLIDYEDQTWALLRFANTSLALVKPEEHPYHIAITTDDLAAYGKPVLHRDGTKSVYIRDADGNYLEMLKLAEAGK